VTENTKTCWSQQFKSTVVTMAGTSKLAT